MLFSHDMIPLDNLGALASRDIIEPGSGHPIMHASQPEQGRPALVTEGSPYP
jgi:hypothetical protein